MKKLFLCLFVIFIETSCFATSNFDILKSNFEKCVTKKDFLKCLDIKYDSFEIINKYPILSRNIDFGYYHTAYKLQIGFDFQPGRFFCETFRIYLVTDSTDRIIFGMIQKLEGNQIEVAKSEIFRSNDIQIVNYLKSHKSFYKSLKTKEDFIKQFTELEIYGVACGIGGVAPSRAKQMKEFIQNENSEKLSSWLRELNPELQAYAIKGLLTLKRAGIHIKQDDLNIIEYLSVRNSNVYNCRGCSIGSTTTIKEIINQIP